MRRGLQKRKRARMGIRVITVLLVIALILVFLNGRLRPIITSMAESQARILSTIAINEAVTEELGRQDVEYSELVHVNRDGNGTIKGIEVDIARVNYLKAAITNIVQNKMLETTKKEITVPLGNLTGSDLFIGRGPKIPIQLNLSRSVVTETQSSFNGVGINQTHHLITMVINAKVYVMVTGYRTAIDVTSNFILAETVIVGEVPDAYTSVADSQLNAAQDIMDYGQGR